jgi:acetylornithine deacetylase/succinyl-diaminopimelate desuccinylase-like protein
MPSISSRLEHVLATLDGRKAASITSLKQFLSIPSVSAQPGHAHDVQLCAAWLAEQLRFADLDANVIPTAGHPLVIARNKHQAGRPTVLLYGHYDVQPAEPLDLWTSPPFAPAVRDGAIWARGAADDKGQVWAHVEAIMAWQGAGGLPVNLIAVIEGEEEVGSVNLGAYLKSHRHALQCDIAIVSDTSMFSPEIPAITYGLRGLVYLEVILTGATHDLHSGIYGGVAPNPANALCEILATLHDEKGRVNVPGMYDDLDPVSEAERAMWESLLSEDEQTKKDLGIDILPGETDFSPRERAWARPTCDINGITSGYQGPGAKTVIPAQASAKVSMRLAPRQDPAKIEAAFIQAMHDRCPAGYQLKIISHGGSPAVLTPLEGPAIAAAKEACEIGFGAAPAMVRGGGSIPVVGYFSTILDANTLLVGFGLSDDRVHSPNEKFNLNCLHGGARTAAALYETLARKLGSPEE